MRYQPGDTVGPYRVTGYIGEGASGVVYQVVNGVTGRLDAMKVLADGFNRDLEQANRFLREIQVHAKLDHPNIAQVRTAFCEGSTIVLVMELVDGESLGALLRRGLPRPPEAVRIAGQILNALTVAHREGIVHRDVKPANILIDRSGAAKLTDFGLAQHYDDAGQTGEGMAVGTAYYMAPEQVRGIAATDWRADLYAVGVLLYEMLTGRRPFDGSNHYSVMRAHVESFPPPVSRWRPELSKEVDAVVARALQKDPAARFQSAAGFLAALQQLRFRPPEPPRPRWRYPVYASAVGCLLLAAFALPAAFFEPDLEPLHLLPPPAPPGPPEALLTPAAPVPEAPPVPPIGRGSALETSKPQHAAPVRASRIEPAETPAAIEPPPLRPPAAHSPPLPVPPKMPVYEPAAAPASAVVQPALPTQKPASWMRRNLGRVPKIFRRRDADPDPKPPK